GSQERGDLAGARATTTRMPTIGKTTVEVSAEIKPPAVITSRTRSPNLPLPLGRKVVTAIPFAPGTTGSAVANWRGTVAKDGPDGLAASKANRRYKLVRGR